MTPLLWAALDAATTAFNHVAVALHIHVDHAVGGDAFLSFILTTFIVSAVMALVLTGFFMALWLGMLRSPTLQLWQRLSRLSAVTARGPTATPSLHVSSTAKRGSWQLPGLQCSCCNRAPAEVVLKLRLHGEAMWHRFVLDRRRVRTMAALHDAVRAKLAAFATADAAGAVQGFSPADLRVAKVARLTLLPDVLLSEDADVATLKAGDELEVQLKL